METFVSRWIGKLEERARVVFEVVTLPEVTGTHCDVADAVAKGFGQKTIGFNWEMLDSEGGFQGPRTALGTIAGALEADMEYPKQTWLGADDAAACAQDFLALFNTPRTILSNRLEGLWNPISDARIEWAFVGFDGAHAALLLLARD